VQVVLVLVRRGPAKFLRRWTRCCRLCCRTGVTSSAVTVVVVLAVEVALVELARAGFGLTRRAGGASSVAEAVRIPGLSSLAWHGCGD
jgi:hypothetical protein